MKFNEILEQMWGEAGDNIDTFNMLKNELLKTPEGRSYIKVIMESKVSGERNPTDALLKYGIESFVSGTEEGILDGINAICIALLDGLSGVGKNKAFKILNKAFDNTLNLDSVNSLLSSWDLYLSRNYKINVLEEICKADDLRRDKRAGKGKVSEFNRQISNAEE
jgi:hypothetical protein